MMNTENKTTFKVHAENLDTLKEQVEKINKRVARLVKRGYNVSPIVISIGEMFVETIKETGYDMGLVKEVERVFANVELVSPKPPKIDGWAFIAALTHVEDVGTVLRVCPGAEVSEGELKAYRNASSENCDHCHAARRRNDTFIIRNPQGELKQVGRQCLQAYTGLGSPEELCAMAEILMSASDLMSAAEDDGFGGSGGGRRYVSIAKFLPFVACSIRESGWLSRGEAFRQGRAGASTCDLAFSYGVYAEPHEEGRYIPNEKDYALAAATIEFCEDHFANCDIDSLSDYENSLRVAMASGIAHPKFAGLIASAIGYYKRDVERRARNEEWAKMVSKSTFQGTVGGRQVFENLKVLSCREWQSEYGVTYFYSFMDEAGNAFTYFASRDFNLEPGQVISLKATVKKHENYTPKFKNAPVYAQTTLTRCTLVTRAKFVSHDVTEVEESKRIKPTQEEIDAVNAQREAYARRETNCYPQGPYDTFKTVIAKYNNYHFVADDGRKFILTSKSKKKGFVPGRVAILAYDVVDYSMYNNGERPVALADIVTGT